MFPPVMPYCEGCRLLCYGIVIICDAGADGADADDVFCGAAGVHGVCNDAAAVRDVCSGRGTGLRR